jgi:hypothetical protein
VTDADSSEPVEPRLFQLVEEYAEQLQRGEVDAKRPGKRPTPLVEFTRTFYQQFFEHEYGLEIQSVDQQTKLLAVRKRIELESVEGNKPAVLVIGWFEELCDMWPDVLGFSYGGSTGEYLRFHKSYVPRLLERVVKWATANGHTAVAEAAGKALEVYRPVADSL